MSLGNTRPRRALKSLLQDAGFPTWLRDATPLVFCGDELIWVAGLGFAADVTATAPAIGITLVWQPSDGPERLGGVSPLG